MLPHLITPTVLDRFWKKVNKHSGRFWNGSECWEWTAGRSGNGYGAFKIRGKQWGAHQVSYHIHYARVRIDLWVLHRCDNPICVRPMHLYAGTPSQNSRQRDDTFRRARVSADHRGEANPKARITEALALEIVAACHDTSSRAQVARDFGLPYHIVADIWLGRSWRSLVR